MKQQSKIFIILGVIIIVTAGYVAATQVFIVGRVGGFVINDWFNPEENPNPGILLGEGFGDTNNLSEDYIQDAFASGLCQIYKPLSVEQNDVQCHFEEEQTLQGITGSYSILSLHNTLTFGAMGDNMGQFIPDPDHPNHGSFWVEDYHQEQTYAVCYYWNTTGSNVYNVEILSTFYVDINASYHNSNFTIYDLTTPIPRSDDWTATHSTDTIYDGHFHVKHHLGARITIAEMVELELGPDGFYHFIHGSCGIAPCQDLAFFGPSQNWQDNWFTSAFYDAWGAVEPAGQTFTLHRYQHYLCVFRWTAAPDCASGPLWTALKVDS